MPTPPHDLATARSGWVLHLVPPNGGGVDRFVRDVWAHRPQDRVLHIGPTQWVLEQPGHHFTPLPTTAIAEPLFVTAIGQPAWVHAHAVSAHVRQAAAALATITRAPLAITLHDITFTQGDASEQTAALAFLQQAQLLTAPSHYLCQVLSDHLKRHAAPPLACALVPNGLAAMNAGLTPVATPHVTGFDIAVVGAMGPHKGLQHLLDLCAALPPKRRVVLIGYADGQLGSGWKVQDRLWVHGPFEPSHLPALLESYGAKLVFFPAGQPESFCYALSDVWQAGWPVLVPDQGALGERVRLHGQGQVYDPALPMAALAQRVEHALTEPISPSERREPTVAEMVARLEDLYHMTDHADSAPPQAAILQTLAQTHLDSHFFRLELLRLQGDLEAVRRENAAMQDELAHLSRAHQARGEWIQKLEGDINQLQQALQHEQARFGALRAAVRRWKALTGKR